VESDIQFLTHNDINA